MMKWMSWVFLVVLFWVAAGCQTLTDRTEAERVANTLRSVAFAGTADALAERPEWRESFEEAAEDLAVIETLDTVDLDTVLRVIARLPASELQSDRARLYLAAGTMILEEYETKIDLDDHAAGLRVIVGALREGIERGLAWR